MCGFAGCLETEEGTRRPPIGEVVQHMTAALGHRGPDDERYGIDTGLAIGFRRLAIMDPERGAQPMRSADGHYLLVCNGEIYNHVELRAELSAAGERLRTGSDTEVLLAMWRRHGVEALDRLRGMYAFAVWDAELRELFAARDPFGIKPLYWAECDGRLLFASEQKALRTVLGTGRPDRAQVERYLQFQYVPGPGTLSPGISALPPGGRLWASPGLGVRVERGPVPRISPARPATPVAPAIRGALRDSVRAHLRSDVPVGAFLSGGIDSTSIVALAAAERPGLETFSIGFDEPGYSEVALAERSAEALGVRNTAMVIGADDFIRELPRIVWHLDDPVADPSVVPLWFLARMASERVKVVLSGEGADELFAGYRVYGQHPLVRALRHLPAPARRELRGTAGLLPAGLLPAGLPGRGLLERGATPLEEWFIGNARVFDRAEVAALTRADQPASAHELLAPRWAEVEGLDDVSRMQHVDIHSWLVGDILTKADRMSMAHGLEVRVPFLDPAVLGVAAGLPAEAKTGGGSTKLALRAAMADLLPEGVAVRPKLGFPVPLAGWLRGELHDWARDVISGGAGDLVDVGVALDLLGRHRTGPVDRSRRIWAVLVLCVWYQVFVTDGARPLRSTPISAEMWISA
jgi:asparagine synthase (glutamine-hydrolysing)